MSKFPNIRSICSGWCYCSLHLEWEKYENLPQQRKRWSRHCQDTNIGWFQWLDTWSPCTTTVTTVIWNAMAALESNFAVLWLKVHFEALVSSLTFMHGEDISWESSTTYGPTISSFQWLGGIKDQKKHCTEYKKEMTLSLLSRKKEYKQ